MPSTSETPTYSDESSYTPLVEYWLQTQTSAKQVPCLGGTRGGGWGVGTFQKLCCWDCTAGSMQLSVKMSVQVILRRLCWTRPDDAKGAGQSRQWAHLAPQRGLSWPPQPS